MGTNKDMVDLGYNFIGFFGIAAGKSKAFFVGVNGAIRKRGTALVVKYFRLMYL